MKDKVVEAMAGGTSEIVKWKCKKLEADGGFFLHLEVDGAAYKTVQFDTEAQRDAAYSDFAEMMTECGSIGVPLQ
jgi:hypothetical protein